MGDAVPSKSWKALEWTPKTLRGDAVIGVKRYNKPKLTIGCCKLNPISLSGFWDYVAEAKLAGPVFLCGLISQILMLF